jgi:acetyl-CoA carboxylase biotin carboxyl carrier protein
MYKFEEICELIRLVASTRVGSLEIEHGGTRIRVEGTPQISVVDSLPAALHETVPQPSPAATEGEAEAADEDLHFVTSPIVGTFYRAPNPDADPYVKVGDMVREGQTLCIVEAMKLMNEIECEIAGTIVKVFPENANPVEYGERLFAVRPA